MTHAGSSIFTLILWSQPRGITCFRFVECLLSRPCTERGAIVVVLLADPPESGLRRDHQVPTHKRERGSVVKFHSLALPFCNVGTITRTPVFGSIGNQRHMESARCGG